MSYCVPMPDRVWPMTSMAYTRLYSFNGFGFGLLGATRTDPTGRCFITRWFTLLYLPVIPLGRYYVHQGNTVGDSFGLGSTTTTDYQFVGQSSLRFGEILRTYLYWWLFAPAFVLVPIIALLSHANEFARALEPNAGWPVLVLIGLFLTWLFASLGLLVWFLQLYRDRWAPLREPRWEP